jgi:hypothetical protein
MFPAFSDSLPNELSFFVRQSICSKLYHLFEGQNFQLPISINLPASSVPPLNKIAARGKTGTGFDSLTAAIVPTATCRLEDRCVEIAQSVNSEWALAGEGTHENRHGHHQAI